MIQVIENFLPDAHTERERALAATYRTTVHNDLTYRGISEQDEGPECARLRQVLNFEGGHITTGYRRYLEDEENETYIHADADIADWTGVLFLSRPEDSRGGTAFWRYRPYNWLGVPTKEMLLEQGLDDAPNLWKRVLTEGQEERHWQMWDYVPMGFNRLVLFPSALFHSRYPKRAFGTETADSRLIKFYFIKLPAPDPAEALRARAM